MASLFYINKGGINLLVEQNTVDVEVKSVEDQYLSKDQEEGLC